MPRRQARVGLSLLILGLIFLPAPSRAADPWRPIAPEDLNLAAPKVDKDADAEALFWDVRVEDGTSGDKYFTEMQSYIRIKVFTQRGVEAQSRVEIPYENRTTVEGIEGRTLLPGGKIVELKKTDIYDQTLLKARGRKVKAKTFVMPAVEPGAVIEYRWKELTLQGLSMYSRLRFQRDIPIQRLVYRIKPVALPWEAGYSMQTTMFNGVTAPFDKEPDGFFRAAMANVHAFREEADMPPDAQVRPWMLLWYGEARPATVQKYWTDFGRRRREMDRGYFKVTKTLRDAAAEIAAGASSSEQRLEKLYEFCRTSIRNVSDDAAGLTEEQRKKLRDAKNPTQTWEKKSGSGWDIDCLFGALCEAAGFETRLAWLGDGSDMPFDPEMVNPAFLEEYCVAVEVDGQWRFYDPAVTYVPFGMLPWWMEGQIALVSDEKAPLLVRTASSPSAKSRCRRIARLDLDAEGTLRGECRIEYTGHWAQDMKENYDEESAENRAKALEALVQESIGACTIKDITAEHVTDPRLPFTWKFQIEAPAFAQRTGSRLILQPALFQRARPPRFTESRRRHPVQFDYAWSEEDSVSIALPSGCSIESAEAPPPLEIGNFGAYRARLDKTPEGPLVFGRSFHFDRLSFGVIEYTTLKEDFERIHQRDAQAVTLRLPAAGVE